MRERHFTWIGRVQILNRVLFIIAMPLLLLIPDTSLVAALLGLAVATSVAMYSKSSAVLNGGAILVWFCAFVLIWLLTIWTGVDVHRSLSYSVPWVPGAVLIALYFLLYKSALSVDLLSWSAFVTYILLAADVFLVAFAGDWETPQALLHKSRNQFLIVPNDVTIFAVLLPLSLLVLRKSSWVGLYSIGGLLILLSAIIGTMMQSRSLLAILLIQGVLLLALLHKRLNKQLLLVIGAGCLAILVLLFVIHAHKYQNYAEARLELWKHSLVAISQKPMFGYGPNNFVHTYQDISASAANWYRVQWPHNLYLEMGVNSGLFGFFVFIGLLYRMVRNISSWYKADRVTGAALLLAVTGFLAAGMVELSFIRLWCVLVFCLLIAGSLYPNSQAKPIDNST